MSIKSKLSWLLIGWSLLILLIANTIIYFSYVHLTENRELEGLEEISDVLVKAAKERDIAAATMRPFLKSVLPDDGMIRILDGNGNVLLRVADEDDAATFPIRKHIDNERSEIMKIDGESVAVYAIPISKKHPEAGSIELSKNLSDLHEDIELLLMVLIGVSVFLISVAMIFGYTVAKRFLQPVSIIGATMDRIQANNRFEKIVLPKKKHDEVSQLAENFNRMMESLETAFHKQEQFIGDASHELKTPLTVIENYASMLNRWGKEEPALLEEGMEAIQAESKRMKHMVEQLLDLASVKNQTIEVKKLNMTALCKQTAKRLEIATKRAIQVTSQSDIWAIGDEGTCIQILFILLDNAVKYSKHAIHVDISKLDQKVIIQVIDRGIGIPAEALPRLFERFYRVDQSRTRATGGNGLGLAIAQDLAKMNDGTLQVKSELGNGTTVQFILPAAN